MRFILAAGYSKISYFWEVTIFGHDFFDRLREKPCVKDNKKYTETMRFWNMIRTPPPSQMLKLRTKPAKLGPKCTDIHGF